VITSIPNVEGDPNRGAALFDQNCAVCHGSNGEGRVGAALAKSFSSIRPDLAVKNIIASGVTGSPMPAWSQANGGPLAEQDVDDLTAFVLTLAENPVIFQPETPAEPEIEPSWLSGWGGIILGVGLFVLIVGFAIWYQNRDKGKKQNQTDSCRVDIQSAVLKFQKYLDRCQIPCKISSDMVRLLCTKMLLDRPGALAPSGDFFTGK
jgi:cytochrome c553